ncbi:MAG: ATP-binding protein [Dehalococcoidia bacterium]|nr:ATP-binding protein [Dehalococcoidia bacterium]
MPTGNSPRIRPAIVLLTGLPGAGKSTFAAALQRRRPVRPLESDAIRRELAPRPAYTRSESTRVFDIVEARATEALDAGAVPVIDATNVANADRRRFLRLARERDAVLVAVRVVAPTSTIRERLGSASRRPLPGRLRHLPPHEAPRRTAPRPCRGRRFTL